jgi:hypothetical protein
MLKIVFKIATVIFSTLTLFFIWVSIDRYQMPHNEAGNYFDVKSGINYDDGRSLVYGLLAFICLIVFMIFYKLARLKPC